MWRGDVRRDGDVVGWGGDMGGAVVTGSCGVVTC